MRLLCSILMLFELVLCDVVADLKKINLSDYELVLQDDLDSNLRWSKDSQNVRWASNCDFKKTEDLTNRPTSKEQCSHACKFTSSCTHFVWAMDVCWMKQGFVSQYDATYVKENNNMFCGLLKIEPINYFVRNHTSCSRLCTKEEFFEAVRQASYLLDISDEKIVPLLNRNQYINFVDQAGPIGKITNKRELAMALAQILYTSKALTVKSEKKCEVSQCPKEYRDEDGPPGKNYFGRGFMQLTGSDNYVSASFVIYGDDRILMNPELVESENSISWAASLWYWYEKKRFETYGPAIAYGEFGASTNALYGPIECKADSENLNAKKRFQLYVKVIEIFKVDVIPNEMGCYKMN